MNNEQLEYCLVRDVKEPCRAHPQDAGIDFFVPNNLTVSEMISKNRETQNQYLVEGSSDIVSAIALKPSQRVLIPSGVKVKVPDGYMLMYDNKSGVASKKGLIIGAKIVDIGYEGECHLNLINSSDKEVLINPGDKICQGILVKIGFHTPKRVENEEALYGNVHSARGEGGFGSTDKQKEMSPEEFFSPDKEYGPDATDDSTGYEWYDSHFINFNLYEPTDGTLSIRLDEIAAVVDSAHTPPVVSTIVLKSGASFVVTGSYDQIRDAIANHS